MWRFSECEFAARLVGSAILRGFLFLVILSVFSAGAKSFGSQGNKEHGRIEGKVSAASGEAIAGALVSLVGKDGEKKIAAKSNTDGIFVLLDPPEGTYALYVDKPGWTSTVVDAIRLSPGQTKHVDVALRVLADGVRGTGGNESARNEKLKFSDEPNFTIAGVTDWSSAGLHGSTANARTSEDLAKETAALKSNLAGGESESKSAADTHRVLGDAKEKNGDPVGAVNEYEKAARIDPSEGNYFAWGAELLLHRAAGAAIEVFSKGAKEHANSAAMLAGLGAAFYANGQFEAAARRICEASDLRPLESEPYLLLGKMEEAAAEPLPCSEEKLARFAEQRPEDARANYYYGLVLWKRGRKSQSQTDPLFERAKSLFTKALAIDPAFAEAYVQLGLIVSAQGHLQETIRIYQKAVEANPKFALAHYQLSLAYRRAGEIAKAENELRTYKETEREEALEAEKERRELRQFVTIFRGDRGAAKPQ